MSENIAGHCDSQYLTFTVKNNITPTVTLSATSYTYDGKVKTPTVTVKNGDTVLPSSTYTVSWSGNRKDVGTYKVTVTMTGNYIGSGTASFKINKAAQKMTVQSSAMRVSVGKSASLTVTETKEDPVLTYTSSDPAIATVSEDGVVTAHQVGTVEITVSAASTKNYRVKTATITIKVVPGATTSLKTAKVPKGIKLYWKQVPGAKGYYVYRDGEQIKKITSGSTVSFIDATASGNGTKYTYKLVAYASTGTSKLSKSVTTYQVTRPTITKYTNSSSRKMTIKWDGNEIASGYKILYSLDKDFKKDVKTIDESNGDTVSKVISKLTKGKTYYVRMRTYTVIGGKNYYSAWSDVRAVTIKK